MIGTKAKTRFISFGSTPIHYNAAVNLTDQALSIGKFDTSHVYTKSNVDDWFAAKNKHILRQPLGDGCWLWKPFIIFKELCALADGDILVYCDSLYDMIKDHPIPMSTFITDTLSMSTNDIFCVHNKPNDGTYPETAYTKGDSFVIIPGGNKASNGPQIWAGFIGIKKSLQSLAFVSEWLAYCQDDRLVTDKKDEVAQPFANFIQNRRDQSVLSLVAKKWNITFNECPPMLNDLRNPFRFQQLQQVKNKKPTRNIL